MGGLPAQGLTASERVRRRQDFERVYEQGARVRGRFMTVFVLPNGTEAGRFGVAATRKLGCAVERNRAKRLAREIFRRHKKGSVGLDVVIVPRQEMLDAPFPTLERDYLRALDYRGEQQASSIAGRRGSPGTHQDL